jgi:hypothetical protein
MIQKIEVKMENHVKSILKKDAIDFADYQILADYLARLNRKKEAAEWEAESEERNERFKALCETLISK